MLLVMEMFFSSELYRSRLNGIFTNRQREEAISVLLE